MRIWLVVHMCNVNHMGFGILMVLKGACSCLSIRAAYNEKLMGF